MVKDNEQVEEDTKTGEVLLENTSSTTNLVPKKKKKKKKTPSTENGSEQISETGIVFKRASNTLFWYVY